MFSLVRAMPSLRKIGFAKGKGEVTNKRGRGRGRAEEE